MAKKHTVVLDFDDEPSSFDDIAILFFRTDTPNYLFADDLNHLYQLALSRIDDLVFPNTPQDSPGLPLYTFHNQLEYLDYYLVDLSTLQASTQTKLLIIRGEATDDTVQNILRDFNEPPAAADPHNIELLHRNDILLAYQQALTSVSLYDPQPPVGLSKKAAKERQELDNLLTSILDLIDLQHL